MNKIFKQLLAATGMAFLLSSCGSNSKPFEKVSTAGEEWLNALCESPTDEESSREKLCQAIQELEGMEIETEVVDVPGMTLKKAFTVDAVKDNTIRLSLEATTSIDEAVQTSSLAAIGYDGDKPIYYLKPYIQTRGDDIVLSVTLMESALCFLPEVQAIKDIDKIVITADTELIERMQEAKKALRGYR